MSTNFGGIPTVKAFTYAYRGLMAKVAEMSLVKMFGAHEILKVLTCKLDLKL